MWQIGLRGVLSLLSLTFIDFILLLIQLNLTKPPGLRTEKLVALLISRDRPPVLILQWGIYDSTQAADLVGILYALREG